MAAGADIRGTTPSGALTAHDVAEGDREILAVLREAEEAAEAVSGASEECSDGVSE